jgi:hypothetical protein
MRYSNIKEITFQELGNVLKHSKNRKSGSVVNTNMKLWKYGREKLEEALLKLLSNI